MQAALSRDGFGLLAGHELISPPLLWSETPSALHEMAWRGTISSELAGVALERFVDAPIKRRNAPRLPRLAWTVADELGLAKTYDAEYVATARSLDCPLITVDQRLLRSASRLIEVMSLHDL